MMPYRPIARARIELGQFAPFVSPGEITGDKAPTTPPQTTAPAAVKPGLKTMVVLTGLAMTGISAATAYVGIQYGMEKGRSEGQRALGWTVGVIAALGGLVRLVATGALAMKAPPQTSEVAQA